MNPVILFFLSGDSLYCGAALLLLALATSPCLKQPWLLRCRNIVAWIALILIVMAGPPFPWVIDAILLMAFALWFVGSNWSVAGRAWFISRLVATFVLASLLLVLPAVELSHRGMPQIVGMPCDHLVVIGDSISSGVVPRRRHGRE